MLAQHRTLTFGAALVGAVLLALLAVLYLTGLMPLDPRVHVKHALLFFALAAGALAIANFNRPGAQRE